MNIALYPETNYERKGLYGCRKNKPNQTQFHTQRLGFFGRYGWAGSKVNEVTNFWSAGRTLFRLKNPLRFLHSWDLFLIISYGDGQGGSSPNSVRSTLTI